MRRTIGIIGAGAMGGPMADRLVAAGHEVKVCDTNPACLEPFANRGIAVTTRPADVADGDFVFVIVADDAQLLSVTRGPNGMAAGLEAARRPIVLAMSTCMPATVAALRAEIEPHGGRVIDAPVSGGPTGAHAGTLSIMLGGDSDVIEEARPLLECLGRNLFVCGPLGSGQVAKLINNMIGLTNLYLVSEALDLARRAGADPRALLPVIDASSGRTYLSRDGDISARQFAGWSADEAAFTSLARIVRKDMASVRKLAEECGMEAPVLASLGATVGDAAPAVFERWRVLAVALDRGL